MLAHRDVSWAVIPPLRLLHRRELRDHDSFNRSFTLEELEWTVSAEAYKVGAAYPYARIPRLFLRQTIDLGGDVQKVDAGINQFAGSQTTDRLVITVGKFSVVDIFDSNKYAHDPSGDFLNWTLVNTGTFDYAADAWAFTYGAAVEWYTGPWTFRAGVFDGPVVPNSTDLDPAFGQFQMVGEIKRRYELWGQPGKIAVTGYLTRARMGNFADAVQLAALTGGPADITAVRTYASKPGISANMEQQILPGVGLFARAGYTPASLRLTHSHRHRCSRGPRKP